VDGRIVEVGTDVRAPVGAEVIDARGLVVMPGLIDAHVHVTAATADLSAISTWPVSYVTAQDGAVVLDRR
jgi:imidazolonepropionase-like amidohydrolase